MPIYLGNEQITQASLGNISISKLIINSVEIATAYATTTTTTTTEAP